MTLTQRFGHIHKVAANQQKLGRSSYVRAYFELLVWQFLPDQVALRITKSLRRVRRGVQHVVWAVSRRYWRTVERWKGSAVRMWLYFHITWPARKAIRAVYRLYGPWFVSVYENYQIYGGPEEGGWWTYRQAHLDTVGWRFGKENARRFREELEQRATLAAENEQRVRRVNEGLASMPDGPDPYHDTEGYIPRGQVGSDEVGYTVEPWPGWEDNSSEPIGYYE